MAMALYKHWFVDFGPFQDGEFIDSELGPIPKGWEVKRLDEVTTMCAGGDKPKVFSKEETEDLKIPIYSKFVQVKYIIDSEKFLPINEHFIKILGNAVQFSFLLRIFLIIVMSFCCRI